MLLEDLWHAFEKDTHSNYHIGIMSIADSGDGSGTLDIIDGQQRMTTLMLIGKAAESRAAIWTDFLIHDQLALYGRTSDQAILQNPQDAPKTAMGRAFHCAKVFLAEKPEPKAKEFSEFIFKHAAFFVSQAPIGYSVIDKNQQFVRLNNRGRQLERHEILKVRLASLIKNTVPQSIFLKHWNAMLECLSEQPVTNYVSESEAETLAQLLERIPPVTELAKERLYSAIVSVPEFLLIALARMQPESCMNMKPDFLLETFSQLADPARVMRFGEILHEQTRFLAGYFIFTPKKGKIAYELGLKGWGDKSESQDSAVADVFDALVMTQSFLHVSTPADEWLIPAFNWCEENKPQIEPSAFKDKLEKIDGENQTKKNSLPSIDEMKFGKISHYWFYRLDYELWKSFKNSGNEETDSDIWTSLNKEAEKLVKNFQFRKCGSVEHINPQNPMEGESDPNINLFGNLALISGSRNSSFSNQPMAGKKQMIRDSGYTESLKMVHFLWCNSDTVEAGKTMHSLLDNNFCRNNGKAENQ